MGCCASNYSKNKAIDSAFNIRDIIIELSNLQRKNLSEIDEIQLFLKNGTPFITENLIDFDSDSLSERVKYLNKLNVSYTLVIDTLKACNNVYFFYIVDSSA